MTGHPETTEFTLHREEPLNRALSRAGLLGLCVAEIAAFRRER